LNSPKSDSCLLDKCIAGVDITDVICPVTYVKATVALEDIEAGEILQIRINTGQPIENVPRSLKEDGHKIVDIFANEDGTYTLLVEKNGLDPRV